MTAPPRLEVVDLARHFAVRGRAWPWQRRSASIKAVDGVSFSIARGETLALIGESGCGKSTVGRLVMRLIAPTRGRIRLDGIDITDETGETLRSRRRQMQIVFQDPYASLNPRLTAEAIIAEPLENFGMTFADDRSARVRDLLRRVGLPADSSGRYPFEFSGGQRQRLGLARALALDPALIVADEPVSALDVSVQAQVLNLMLDLQRELGLTYLFISHDLAVVRHIATRVAVMYLGRIVEFADTETLFSQPRHPYTQALIAAAPVADPRAPRRRVVLVGDVPSALVPPSGCPFHPRCPRRLARCAGEVPPLRPIAYGPAAAEVACHLVDPTGA